MGLFGNFFSKKNAQEQLNEIDEQLKGLAKAQELLDQRFNKKEISNELYKQKSLEFLSKKDKLQSKRDKLENNN